MDNYSTNIVENCHCATRALCVKTQHFVYKIMMICGVDPAPDTTWNWRLPRLLSRLYNKLPVPLQIILFVQNHVEVDKDHISYVIGFEHKEITPWSFLNYSPLVLHHSWEAPKMGRDLKMSVTCNQLDSFANVCLVHTITLIMSRFITI